MAKTADMIGIRARTDCQFGIFYRVNLPNKPKVTIENYSYPYHFFGLGSCGFKSGYFGWFGGSTRLLLSSDPSSFFGFGPGLIA